MMRKKPIPKEPKPRGPSINLRKKARDLYESGESIAAVSRATGIRRQTLCKLRDKEGWQVRPSVQVDARTTKTVQQRAQAQVIDITTRRVVDEVVDSGIIGMQADLIARTIEEHAVLAAEMVAYAREVIADARAGRIEIPRTQTTADLANAVAGIVARAISISRDVAGLRSGQASTGKSNDSDEPIRIEQRRLETVKIAVDERGRMIDGNGMKEVS
jgi:hypothetical protein